MLELQALFHYFLKKRRKTLFVAGIMQSGKKMNQSDLNQDSCTMNGLGDFSLEDLDADMDGFRESLSSYRKSDIHEFYLGISPTHSADSGVDNIEEYMFDFENNSCFANELWEEKTAEEDAIVNVTDDLPWLGSLTTQTESKGTLKNSSKSKLEETIDEDHCYTTIRGAPSNVTCPAGDTASFQKIDQKDGVKREHLQSQMASHGITTEKTAKGRTNVFEKIAVEDSSERCNNRNAIMARLNRQRKKRYVGNLESEVSTLRKQNTSLLAENSDLKVSISKCREELTYLRHVLENQSMLSSVIKAVSCVPGVNLRGVVKASDKVDKSENKASGKGRFGNIAKQEGLNEGNGIHQGESSSAQKSNGSGVCLHIQKENVSIEFCHHCNLHSTSEK